MKSAIPIALIISAAFLVKANIHSTAPSDLTVHEWGTFTSVAGEDGTAVDWDALGCKSDLPRFVNDFGYRGFKWRLQGTVRMETPVLYFYSPRPLDARVKVAFPHGLITEWYPKAEYEVYQGSGVDGAMRRLPANLNGIDFAMRNLTGGIEWKNIKIQPNANFTPAVETEPSRYYAARATDATPISVDGQQEKFLFYRGVGRFPVPVSIQLASNGSVVAKNTGAGVVPVAILFENRSGRIGYRMAGSIEKSVAIDPPRLDGSFAELRQKMESSLIAQGLFPKEAQAMLETWRDSWFEEGSRIIYIVPAPAVDAFLPLEIEPAPSQILRVFVGRIELITEETKRTVRSAAATNDWPTVDRYSRFLDPILQRMYAGNAAKAEEIRKGFRSHLGAEACR